MSETTLFFLLHYHCWVFVPNYYEIEALAETIKNKNLYEINILIDAGKFIKLICSKRSLNVNKEDRIALKNIVWHIFETPTNLHQVHTL